LAEVIDDSKVLIFREREWQEVALEKQVISERLQGLDG
jgi:hypothetical protein